MSKHFKLRLDLKKVLFGTTLFQIEATIKGYWGDVGTLGGFIEKETNVSGNAWVYGNARVSGDAQVYGNAQVSKFGDCVVINNQKNTITLIPNLITIGCLSWSSLELFDTNYKRKGEENGYTEDEILMTKELVHTIMKRIQKIELKSIKINHEGKEFEIDIEQAKKLGIIK